MDKTLSHEESNKKIRRLEQTYRYLAISGVILYLLAWAFGIISPVTHLVLIIIANISFFSSIFLAFSTNQRRRREEQSI